MVWLVNEFTVNLIFRGVVMPYRPTLVLDLEKDGSAEIFIDENAQEKDIGMDGVRQFVYLNNEFDFRFVSSGVDIDDPDVGYPWVEDSPFIYLVTPTEEDTSLIGESFEEPRSVLEEIRRHIGGDVGISILSY